MQRAASPEGQPDDTTLATKKYRLFPAASTSPPEDISDLAATETSPRRRRRSSSLDDQQTTVNASRHARRPSSKRSRHSTSTVHDVADSPTVPKRFTFRSEITSQSDETRTTIPSESMPESTPSIIHLPGGWSGRPPPAQAREALRSNPMPAQSHKAGEDASKTSRVRKSSKNDLRIDVAKTRPTLTKAGSDDDRPPPPPPKDLPELPREGPVSPGGLKPAKSAKSARSSWSHVSIHDSTPVVLQSVGTMPTYAMHKSAASAVNKANHTKPTSSVPSSSELMPTLSEKKSISRKPIGPKKAAAERKAAIMDAAEAVTSHASKPKIHGRSGSDSVTSPPRHGKEPIGLGIHTDGSWSQMRSERPRSPASMKRPKTAPDNRHDRSEMSREDFEPMPNNMRDLRPQHETRVWSPNSANKSKRDQRPRSPGGREVRPNHGRRQELPANSSPRSRQNEASHRNQTRSRSSTVARPQSPSSMDVKPKHDPRKISPLVNQPSQNTDNGVSPLVGNFDQKQDQAPVSPVTADSKSYKSEPSSTSAVSEIKSTPKSERMPKSTPNVSAIRPPVNSIKHEAQNQESSDDDLPPPPPMKDHPPTPRSAQFSTKAGDHLKTLQSEKDPNSRPSREKIRFDLSAHPTSPNTEGQQQSDATSPQGKSRLREWASRPASSHGPQYICHQMFSKVPASGQRSASNIVRRLSLRSRPVTPDPEKGHPNRAMSPDPIIENPNEWGHSGRENFRKMDSSKVLQWGKSAKQKLSGRPVTPEISVRPPSEQLLADKTTTKARPISPASASVTKSIDEVTNPAGHPKETRPVKIPSRKSEIAPEVVEWMTSSEAPPKIPSSLNGSRSGSPVPTSALKSASKESLALKSQTTRSRSRSPSNEPSSLEALRKTNTTFNSAQDHPRSRNAKAETASSDKKSSELDNKAELEHKEKSTRSNSPRDHTEVVSEQSAEAARSSSRLDERPSSRLDSLGSKEALEAAALLRARMRNFDLLHRPSTPEAIATLTQEPLSPSQERARSTTPTGLELLDELSKESDALYERYTALRAERQKISNAIIEDLKVQRNTVDSGNLIDQHLALNSISSSMNICFAKLKSLDLRREEIHSAQMALMHSKLRVAENVSQRLPSLRFSSSKITETGLRSLSQELGKPSRRSLSHGSLPTVSAYGAKLALDIKEKPSTGSRDSTQGKHLTKEPPLRESLDISGHNSSTAARTKKEVTPKSSSEISIQPMISNPTTREVKPSLSVETGPHLVPSRPPSKESSPMGRRRESSPMASRRTSDALIPLRLAAKATRSKSPTFSIEPNRSKSPAIEIGESSSTEDVKSSAVESDTSPTKLEPSKPESTRIKSNGRRDSVRETPKIGSERASNESTESDQFNRTAPLAPLAPVESAPTDESEEEATKPKKIRIRSAKAASILARMGRPMTGRLSATEMIAPIKHEKESSSKTSTKTKPTMHIELPKPGLSILGQLPPPSPEPKRPLPQSPQPQAQPQLQSRSRRNSSSSEASATTVVRDVKRDTQIPAMPIPVTSESDAATAAFAPAPPSQATAKTQQPKTTAPVPRKVANLAKRFENTTSNGGNSPKSTGYAFPQPPKSSSSTTTKPLYEMRANNPWIGNKPPTPSDETAPVIVSTSAAGTNASRAKTRGNTLPKLDINDNSSARSTPVDESEATTPRIEKVQQARTMRVVGKGSGTAVQIVADDDFLDYYTQSESEDV